MAEPLLAVDLEVRLSDFVVQARFTAQAERVVIFGPSGAGKTLTLRAMAGLIRPARGLLRIGDHILDDSARGMHLSPQDRKIGYMPQNYALFPHLSLVDNIAYGLQSLPRHERRRRVQDLLERMRLTDRADHRPSQLSGGQQQRAALARALAPSPDLLLMDEPLAALEEDLRVELREEIRRLQTDEQIPIVLVTHNVAEAYSLADRLVVILAGQVVQAGEREEVFRHPATPEVARLVGMTNLLEGTVDGYEAGHVLISWRGTRLRAPLGRPIARGTATRFGIRPEELMILRQAPIADSAPENLIPGIVTADRPQGYDHLLTFEADGAASADSGLTIRVPHPVLARLGIDVGHRRLVAIRPEAIHVFQPEGIG
ncbi:MAG TPA: ABC transporter ATP-binding protein [Anaerolineales bacterium]|nr:ABC transporter ATP-binding protein [Anaerolineales bacterium]